MRASVRTIEALLACVALLALVPATAHADGDPASDVLLLQNDYLPYSPPVSPGYQRAIPKLLKETAAAGYPLQVAIIASPQDLGSVPNMFGQPQQYAQFLASEVAFNARKPLLVVMPAGFGLYNVAPNAGNALNGLSVSSSGGSDALARAAVDAIVRLSRAAGHPVAAPKIAGGSGGGGTSPGIVFGVPVVLLAVAGLLASLRRRSTPPHKETATSPE